MDKDGANGVGASSPPKRPPPPSSQGQRPQPPQTPPLSVRQHMEHLQPLGKTKVRWFYQEDKKWIPFNGSDSLKIEEVFRSLPEALQSPFFIPADFDHSTLLLPTVKGSLYEVDIVDRECRAIYWAENPAPIMRGSWFKGSVSGSWEPIDEKQAYKIEETHLQVVRSLGFGQPLETTTSPANPNAIHHIKIGVNRIEWVDISEVYIISESAGSRLAQKIGLSGATELHRGYEFESDETDAPPPISHIVFLVHGMGQLYHGEGGIIHSRKKLSDAVRKANRSLKDKKPKEGRVEFFPIEWRTKLKLDEGIIDKITPSNLSSLRKVLNDTTLDVFYYTSPFYREEIIQAMRKGLNTVYNQYIDRNPSFREMNGKVSIIAHSLGSVIIHDVLTLWNSYLIKKDREHADGKVAGGERVFSWFWGWGKEKSNELPTSSLSLCSEDELKHQLHEARLKIAKIEMKMSGETAKSGDSSEISDKECYSLEFKVENVFNIGSPLGVFLVMRGIRPRDDIEQHILPTSVCKRTYNIYDPTDPVAYRLEPLIYDYYSDIPPVRLSKVCVTNEPKPAKTGGTSSWLRGFFRGKTTDPKSEQIEYRNGVSDIELPKSTDEKTEAILQGKKVLDHRLDYVLEHSMVEYFSAITSHQAYWHSLDFSKFLLHVIYNTINVDGANPAVAMAGEGGESENSESSASKL